MRANESVTHPTSFVRQFAMGLGWSATGPRAGQGDHEQDRALQDPLRGEAPAEDGADGLGDGLRRASGDSAEEAAVAGAGAGAAWSPWSPFGPAWAAKSREERLDTPLGRVMSRSLMCAGVGGTWGATLGVFRNGSVPFYTLSMGANYLVVGFTYFGTTRI